MWLFLRAACRRRSCGIPREYRVLHPACPPDSVPPSVEDYVNAMTPFVTVMGPVCDLLSIEVVNLEVSGASTTTP